MKKVFTNDLPHTHKGKHVNWKECIGHKVKFQYNNIEGIIDILDYYKENKKRYLVVKYENKKFEINANEFSQCKIAELLGTHTKKYKYQENDIITDVHSGKLKILKQIKMKNCKSTQKGYSYQCLLCGNIDNITETRLNKHHGCNVCCNHKILIGYNDMWTINPKLASLLADPEDGYKYTESSNQEADWKCPDCGEIIKNKTVSNINNQGLSCPKCSDNISYPEKFMFNVLEQLEINFKTQLSKATLKWCKNYRYDFYIPDINCVIETHGSGHYTKTFETCGGKTLQEEQENDNLKKELALQNGIKHYIIINCRESNINFIKNNILNSELAELFNLTNINWLKCHEFACSSFVKKVCDLWNGNIKNITKIGQIFKLNRHTIERYLKQGKILGWCDYIVG